MGISLSALSESNPNNSTASATSVASSNSSPSRLPEIPQPKNPDPPTDSGSREIQENPSEENKNLAQKSSEDSIKEGVGDGDGSIEEEEEGECGFCLFMKGGGCKDTFTEWENCVEEGERNKEDIVEKCFGVTSALKKCMEAHSDYYAPVMHAEKAAEAEALKQLEEEKEKLDDKENEEGDSDGSEIKEAS